MALQDDQNPTQRLINTGANNGDPVQPLHIKDPIPDRPESDCTIPIPDPPVPANIYPEPQSSGTEILSNPGAPQAGTIINAATPDDGHGAAAPKPAGEVKVFWSGGRKVKDAAEKWARENGGITMEMTPEGRAVESATIGLSWSEAKPMWDKASAEFAQGASGVAHVFQNNDGLFVDSVWGTVEYRILRDNGIRIEYHVVE